ncbi:MAG: leucyl aminopeptidase, partial [Alphaproteobacteria bacterium]|nr:leucyl aminopeptidase [Alphaproteobacteria bacterium]
MKFTFAAKAPANSDFVVAGVFEGRRLGEFAQQLDGTTSGIVSKAAKSGKFSGKTAQIAEVIVPLGLDADKLILIGMGKENSDKIDEIKCQKIGGTIAGLITNSAAKNVTVYVDDDETGEVTAHVAFGLTLGAYRFDKYITKKEDGETIFNGEVSFVSKSASQADKRFEELKAIADGISLTRDVVSEPPNVLYPATMAHEAEKLSELGVKVTVLGESEMEELGMGALLGVGQGSVRESKLAIMEWNGAGNSEAPVAFIGKGVTFDTGGISLKPGAGMDEMKWDMGGSGVVLGLMKALAGRNAKVNAVGIIGLVENMPDGNAQRPGDIVTSMSGQTIEILNTDAEGRLVLADAMWYAQEKYKPQVMIDLATLTGAILVSLGQEHAGLFANDDKLASDLTEAGLQTGDKVWRMP